MKISIIQGDITKIKSDGLVTLVNSGGYWFGGIDGALMRDGNSPAYNELSTAISNGLQEGETYAAYTKEGSSYKYILFTIDNLNKRLNQLVANALQKAHTLGFNKVTFPALRCGVMLGAVEKSRDEVVYEISLGISSFKAANPDTNIEDITFVIYMSADLDYFKKLESNE